MGLSVLQNLFCFSSARTDNGFIEGEQVVMSVEELSRESSEEILEGLSREQVTREELL